MAKKKKLNKRVVLLLALLAVFCVGVPAGIFLMKPNDPVAMGKAGDAALAKGDYVAADKNYNLAIGVAKDKADYMYKLAKMRWEWSIKRRAELSDAQRADKQVTARQWLQKAVMIDPKHLEAQRLLTDIQWQIAVATRNWEAYVHEADRLLELAPQDDETLYRRAMAKRFRAEIDPISFAEGAKADFQKLIELKPDNLDYRIAMAGFLAAVKQTDEAAQVYLDTIKANEKLVRPRLAYAQFLLTQDKKKEAKEQIQLGIEQEPTSADGYLAMAKLSMQENKLQDALDALEKARKCDETETAVYRDMAAIYAYQRDYDKAVAVLTQGLEVVNRRLETAPASQPDANGQRLQWSRFQLNCLMANTLLDKAEAKPAERDNLIQQVKPFLAQVERQGAGNLEQQKIEGRILVVQNNIPEATKVLEKVFKDGHESDLQLAGQLVNLFLQQGWPGKAEELLDRLMQIPEYARNPKQLILKARLKMHYRSYDQALQFLNEALKADPGNTVAKGLKDEIETKGVVANSSAQGIQLKMEQAALMWGEDYRDGAIALLEAVYKANPGDVRVGVQLVQFYANYKQPPDPEKINNALAVLEDLKRAHPEMADALAFQQRLVREPDPESKYRLSMEEAQKISDPLQKLLEKMTICLNYKKQDVYEQYLDQAYKLNPDHPAVIEGRFRLATTKKDQSMIEDSVQRGIKTNIDGLAGRTMTAQALIVQEKWSEAADVLKSLIADQPANKRFPLSLGACYMQLQKYDEAEKTYLALYRSDPGFAPAAISMAKVTEALRKTADSDRYVLAAYRLAPQDPYVRERWLILQEEKSKVEDLAAKVIPARERSLAKSPDDLNNRYHLAVMYERVGRLDKAEEMLRYILDKSPQRMAAAQMLMTFYARNNKKVEIDGLKDALLRDEKDKVGVYVMWGEAVARFNTEQAKTILDMAIKADSSDGRGHLAKARLLASQGQWNEAVLGMEQYVQTHSDEAAVKELVRYQTQAGMYDAAAARLASLPNQQDAETLTLKGDLALRRKDFSAAENLLYQALQINSDYFPALQVRAELYLNKGDYERARADLQKAKEISASPETAMRLAQVCMLMQDPKAARMVYEDILQREKGYLPAIRPLAALYIGEKMWTPLDALLVEARKTFPNDAGLWLLEAESWRLQGDPAKQAQAMEYAYKLSPGAVDIFVPYVQTLIQARNFDKAVGVAKDSPKELAALSLVLQGQAAFAQKKAAQADELFKSALKEAQSPQVGSVMDIITDNAVYGRNKGADKIGQWLDAARPNDWRAMTALVDIYIDGGQLDKAMALSNKAREAAPKEADKSVLDSKIGLVYQQKGDYANSEKAYLASIKGGAGEPTNSIYLATLNNLAYLYVECLNRPDDALQHAEKAYRASSQDPNVMDTYGWVLAKLGRAAEAEPLFKRSLEIRPSAEGRYHLGYVEEKLGSLQDALKQYIMAKDGLSASDQAVLGKTLDEAISRIRRTLSDKEQTK